jgi:hypothetical protein
MSGKAQHFRQAPAAWGDRGAGSIVRHEEAFTNSNFIHIVSM